MKTHGKRPLHSSASNSETLSETNELMKTEDHAESLADDFPFESHDAENENPNTAPTRPLQPDATYRLQFHAGFTFQDARELVPYLSELGITHVYSSPYLRAVAGSSHGYDIVDQSSLNPEIGTEQDYAEFIRELHAYGMGQILDVVPNHMGVASNDNLWWADVLENGPNSAFASFFDIDWVPLKPDLANKVLLPVLGDQFGRILEEGQLTLHFDQGAFSVHYCDRHFPIGMRSSEIILNHRLGELQLRLTIAQSDASQLSDPSTDRLGTAASESAELMEYQSILTAISHLPPQTETAPDKNHERHREQEVIKRRLRELCQASTIIHSFLNENVNLFNGRPGDPSSFDMLDQLLLEQSYRLACWRVAADEINYRRFFDINELAAICIEQPEVFEKTHSLVFRMMEQGQIDGLRIDHPDGLYDPAAYFRRLQQIGHQYLRKGLNPTSFPEESGTSVYVGHSSTTSSSTDTSCERRMYLVVEKILGRGEHIPREWPVNGTTGYEFLNAVNGVFVDRGNLNAFHRVYERFIRQPMNFRDLVYGCKKQIMEVSMSSEISVLGHQLDRISTQNRLSRDFTLNSLTDALREIISCFPVYRTYIDDNGVSDQDKQYIDQAIARAKRRNPAISVSIFDFVREVLQLHFPTRATESEKIDWQRFVGKFQQVTGPVMAKGVEDTAFYIFNRLTSLNEVGGDPDRFGITVAAFHQQNQERQTDWPRALLTSSTHDTKRSEDVRARINVLSELPSEWQRRLSRWSRVNARKKQEVDGEPAPSRNDEYFIYQTLLGTWPLEELTSEGRLQYRERIQQYLLKAAHEAKVHTSWVSPHEPYDQALKSFIASLLDDSSKNPFLIDFIPFARRVAACGIWNSLSQTVLKHTSPGVPDTYQGSELWDFSLVDPDNRRPVNYDHYRHLLKSIQSQAGIRQGDRPFLIQDLMDNRFDGRLKMFVITQLLQERRRHRNLFTSGEYVPLEVVGSLQDHVCAFARRTSDNLMIVVVPRLCAKLTKFSGDPAIEKDNWEDTKLIIPSSIKGTPFENVFTEEVHYPTSNESGCQIPLADILKTFPVAVLRPSQIDMKSAWSEIASQPLVEEPNSLPPLIDTTSAISVAAL